MKTAIVLGGNGFIGHHLARMLKASGYWVRVVDIEQYKYGANDYADEVVHGDLRNIMLVRQVLVDKYQEPYYESKNFDLVFQMAADMGGCQYVFTGENDADIMHNSAQINLNVLDVLRSNNFKGTIFYSSSACIYPEQLQIVPNGHPLKEKDAYPASPDSEYGFEKLFSERLYLAYARNYDIDVRIARFHNIYGPEGVYVGGKEKAPASIARKVAEATDVVKMWEDGAQTRSFMYIEDCVCAVMALIESDYKLPINIGSDESVSIKELWEMAIYISGKSLQLESIPRPANFLGVHGRNSDNGLFIEKIGWNPRVHSLKEGMFILYSWISNQLNCE